jgi:hypothetical protein
MPVNPTMFLCYGRPDSVYAAAITSELWRVGVECYDYQVKSVEDRVARSAGPHVAYLATAQVFVALVTNTSVWRSAVNDEMTMILQVSRGGLKPQVIYLSTPQLLEAFPVPRIADLCIDIAHAGPPRAVVARIVGHLKPTDYARFQQMSQLNRSLFPTEWERLAAIHERAALPTQGFPDVQEKLDQFAAGTGIGAVLRSETYRSSAPVNRAYFLTALADVLSYASEDAAFELRKALAIEGRIDHSGRIGARWDVPEKRYAVGEQLELNSQVIRGLYRVANYLGVLRADDAVDIVNRITWQKTRFLAACGVYGFSVNFGSRDAATAMLAMMEKIMGALCPN